MNLKYISRNIHLIISLCIVTPTAIIYGYSPTNILPQYLDIQVTTNDLSNFLRAIMCLYLGISLIWIFGILQIKYWEIATQLNILFMLTLATGRLLSMIFDGLPTGGYIFGVIAELALGLYSIYQLKKYRLDSTRESL